jgi:L-alanine-DL-glutamate epimerase-like enolase superfamily enzyme
VPEYLPTLKLYTLRLRESFNISKASADEKSTLIVRYGDGVGEGSPSVHYGLPAERVYGELEIRLKSYGAGLDVEELTNFIDALPPQLYVGRCALEMAYLDHAAKAQSASLHRYLDLLRPEKIVSSFTITPGIEAEMIAQCERAEPFDALKLKVGFRRDLDFIDFVLRRKPCRLRLDANGGWTVDQAIEQMRALRGYPIDFIEQPLADPTVRDLDRLKTKAECVIFLDESIIRIEDVDTYAAVIDGINVKLSKCGGILPSLRLVGRAKELKLKLLLGCMIETAVGITAALHLATLFDFFDLDAIMLTENDPFWGAHFDGQTMILPKGNGIAVTTEENTFV